MSHAQISEKVVLGPQERGQENAHHSYGQFNKTSGDQNSQGMMSIPPDTREVDIARAGSTGQKSTHSSAYPVRSPTMHQLAIQKAKEQVKIAMARKAYEAARGFEDDDDFYPG